MVGGKARLYQRIIRFRQRRIIQFDGTPNENLAFFEREGHNALRTWDKLTSKV
ncbi:MAG TPA: hypothetical protein VFS77_09275 [Pyrinomonadaceae bacterium]|nr:hypothetical protein [Pyrinomonadaceae bacterium]